MKLLKQVNTQVNEDAAGGAVGGGAIGGFAMPLFSSLVKRTMPAAPKKKKKKASVKTVKKLSEYVVALQEDDLGMPTSEKAPKAPNATYDTTEVFAKLKAFQNKETRERGDTVNFGLEDDDGNIVRVSVKKDQAESFENALNQFLSSQDEVDGSIPDIAEVLFKLKDHFDIINVEWPEVEEDEEEDQQLDVQGAEGEMGAEGGIDDISGAEGEMGVPEMGGEMGDGDAKSLLVQVIDMMKADAEARKAEAIARQKEAESAVATNAAREAEAKVKKEEEILDMETWEKSKKEEEKEAKRLARLARWKQETGQEGAASDASPEPEIDIEQTSISAPAPKAMGGEEEEKGRSIPSRVRPADVASFILSRVK